MIPQNLETLKHSFEIQAQNFDNTSMNFSKKEYLDYTLDSVQPAATDTVLEVAAGTCACGRTFSPFVKTVVLVTSCLSSFHRYRQCVPRNGTGIKTRWKTGDD